MDGWQIIAGIGVIVGAALLLGLLRKVGSGMAWITNVMADAIASRIITAINGQLGLEALRNDVAELKQQMEEILLDGGVP